MATVRSATLLGLQGWVLEVTAVTEVGLPQAVMPGPDNETQRDRVRAAIINSGLRWPDAKLTVTVLPGGPIKRASATDLAIAVAVATAAGSLPSRAAENVMCYAELGLDGALRPLSGVLPAVTAAAEAGCRAVVVAKQNAAEASLVRGITVIGASRLAQVAEWLCGGPVPEPLAVRLGHSQASGRHSRRPWQPARPDGCGDQRGRRAPPVPGRPTRVGQGAPGEPAGRAAAAAMRG